MPLIEVRSFLSAHSAVGGLWELVRVFLCGGREGEQDHADIGRGPWKVRGSTPAAQGGVWDTCTRGCFCERNGRACGYCLL